jgi:hypothetical protein
MGRIVVQVVIANVLDPSREIRCDGLVDTGTGGLVLPSAWRDRLGSFAGTRTVQLEMPDQRIVSGEVCGPVRISLEGFDTIFNEVTFLDMHEAGGPFEPLVGYIILEQSRAAVDMVGHRLVPVKAMDLK